MTEALTHSARRARRPAAWPWRDRRGRFSPLKAIVLAGLVLPGVGLAVQWAAGELQPRPLEAIIHATGLWGIRFLLLSLCLTPIRQESRYADLVLVRRMIGVGAFAWLFVHLGFYVADQAFDFGLVLREVLGRFYLLLLLLLLLLPGAARTLPAAPV